MTLIDDEKKSMAPVDEEEEPFVVVHEEEGGGGGEAKLRGRSAVSFTAVDGDNIDEELDGIVNKAAKRTSRKQLSRKVSGSPPQNTNTRSNCTPSPTRISRGERNLSKSPPRRPALPPERANSNGSLSSLGEDIDESHNMSHMERSTQTRRRGSKDNTDDDDAEETSSQLQRMNTVDSRKQFIKMLDNKTLTSFRDLNQVVVENNKPRTYISRLFVTFQDCLDRLNAREVNAPKLEAMAILIHECMSGDCRNYHSVQHVFEISTDFQNPLAILAALFHDCIYYNVDGGLTDQQKHVLGGVFRQQEQDQQQQPSDTNTGAAPSSVVCRAHGTCQQDPLLCMVETLFGYERGVEITAPMGLNEFLSAVVAVRQLDEHLTRAQCAIVASCIAGTIPFRNKPPEKEEGQRRHTEKLFDCLVTANDKFDLGMTQDEMVQAIQLACEVANADVGNFGSDDIYYFLDNTWSLLTETNTTLRRSFLYTTYDFQQSLFKMNGFFHFLDPKAIFASFRGSPTDEKIDQLTAQAKSNLEFAQKYVGAKLLSASVLAAFAALTGGDAPLSLFVGDLPSRHHQSQSINDNLPKSEKPIFFSDDDDHQDEAHLDMFVYQVLSRGRRSESSFDVKQSPLGAFLYGVVGDRGLTLILTNKTLYPMNEENAQALLACLPREVVRYLAKTISTVAISRAEKIMEVVENLPLKRRPGESQEDETE